jgi:hypothetical protein
VSLIFKPFKGFQEKDQGKRKNISAESTLSTKNEIENSIPSQLGDLHKNVDITFDAHDTFLD